MAGYVRDGVAYYYGPQAGTLYVYNTQGQPNGTRSGEIQPGVTWFDFFNIAIKTAFSLTEDAVCVAPPGNPSDALENWDNYHYVEAD